MSFNEPKGPWDNERFNCKFFEILLQQFGENFELSEISDICQFIFHKIRVKRDTARRIAVT